MLGKKQTKNKFLPNIYNLELQHEVSVVHILMIVISLNSAFESKTII